MEKKIKRQFGVWLDTQQATVIGRGEDNPEEFVVLGSVTKPGGGTHTSEHSANNAEKTLQDKFFKEIAHHMQNAHEIHITGPGVVQEQFRHFLADTPQFKNAATSDSTNNPMSEQQLIDYMTEKFK